MRTVALNWYRSDDGTDRTSSGPLSLGGTLSCVIWQGMSAILHYSAMYGSDSSAGSIHHLPADASRLRRRIAQAYGHVILDSPPTGELHLDEQFLKPDMIAVPRLASIVRLAQRPIVRLVRRRRSLYVTDWTTARWSRRDPNGLVLYRKSLLKSAIPAVSRKHIAEAELMFPLALDDVFGMETLLQALRRHEVEWTSTACEQMVHYVLDIYREIRSSLVVSTAQFLNMLDFYRPNRVFLPADAFEPWIILYQLCRDRGIETNMCVDGYMCLPLWPALRDESGQGWLVDRALAYGEAQRDHIAKTGFPRDRIDVVDPPFLSYYRDCKAQHEFDAMVLTWIPYTVSPHADYSSPISTLRTVLRALGDAGYEKVAVKVKSTDEIAYVQRTAREVGIRVEILTGRFYMHAGRAPLFIGGISTALAEVAANGGSYVVYEPPENGYTDEMIEASSVLSSRTVVRDAQDLGTALAARATSWLGDVRQNLFVS